MVKILYPERKKEGKWPRVSLETIRGFFKGLWKKVIRNFLQLISFSTEIFLNVRLIFCLTIVTFLKYILKFQSQLTNNFSHPLLKGSEEIVKTPLDLFFLVFFSQKKIFKKPVINFFFYNQSKTLNSFSPIHFCKFMLRENFINTRGVKFKKKFLKFPCKEIIVFKVQWNKILTFYLENFNSFYHLRFSKSNNPVGNKKNSLIQQTSCENGKKFFEISSQKNFLRIFQNVKINSKLSLLLMFRLRKNIFLNQFHPKVLYQKKYKYLVHDTSLEFLSVIFEEIINSHSSGIMKNFDLLKNFILKRKFLRSFHKRAPSIIEKLYSQIGVKNFNSFSSYILFLKEQCFYDYLRRIVTNKLLLSDKNTQKRIISNWYLFEERISFIPENSIFSILLKNIGLKTKNLISPIKDSFRNNDFIEYFKTVSHSIDISSRRSGK